MVKDSDGKVVGCHPTKKKALAQLAALNINVKESTVGKRDSDVYPEPGDVSGLMAHLSDVDHALQGTGLSGDLTQLKQLHLDLHRKESPDHIHPNLDVDDPKVSIASGLPTENLFRAIYPGVAVRDVAGGQPVLTGHFARFNEWTEIDSVFEGRFMEQIAPGAFEDSFRAAPPKILFQHGRDPELGDKVLGSPVTVREDEQGAYYEVPLFPSVPPLLVDGLRAGAYGASFRFSVEEDKVIRKPERSDHNPEGLPERTILKTRTSEAGPVTFPAYVGATATIRSLTDAFRPHDFDREVEEMVRKDSKHLAAVIERAMKGDKDEPVEAKPPQPVQAKFRSREEYLQWLSKS